MPSLVAGLSFMFETQCGHVNDPTAFTLISFVLSMQRQNQFVQDIFECVRNYNPCNCNCRANIPVYVVADKTGYT